MAARPRGVEIAGPVAARAREYNRAIRVLSTTFLRGIFVGLVLASGVVACSSSVNPNKPVAKDPLKVGVGQCLLVDENVKPDVSALPTISCAKAHTHEIFYVYTDTQDDVFPGVSALVVIAKRECYKQFEGYVGISPFDSSLQITWIVPGLDGWNSTKKDRDILCVIRRADDGQIIGTTKGSNL